MEAFASALGAVAGLDASAAYHESEDEGLAAIGDADIAVVTLPFYLRHREALGLVAELQTVASFGATESWTLVASTGEVDGPEDLARHEVHSIAGYAPEFVRAAISRWGELPEGARIAQTSRVMTSLRGLAGGEEPRAVLLDGAQTAALERLPFADKLEIVTASPPVLVSVVCGVGGRPLPEGAAAAFVELANGTDGRDVLETLRLERFEPVDRDALAAAHAMYAAE